MNLITVHPERCERDGICVAVCPLGVIEMTGQDEPPSLVPGADQRCIDCGHCVAVCPTGAMALKTMGPEDCAPIREELRVSREQADQFFMARRSIRAYQDKPVPRETLNKLIHLASYAPAGHNKQFTQWLVIEDRNEIRLLAGLVVEWMRSLLREQPHLDAILDLKLQVESWEGGEECIFRGAPQIIIAHASQYLLTMEPLQKSIQTVFTISLSHVELAAASLGLGACWAGYFMTAAESYPPINEALKLPEGHVSCGGMMIGYPKFPYHRMPLRREPTISWR
jgi:nitroreductase/NAD-dependent dihydropyrimidine dehydrogenase PreA subunit